MSDLKKKTQIEIVVSSSKEGTALEDAKKHIDAVKEASSSSTSTQVEDQKAVTQAVEETNAAVQAQAETMTQATESATEATQAQSEAERQAAQEREEEAQRQRKEEEARAREREAEAQRQREEEERKAKARELEAKKQLEWENIQERAETKRISAMGKNADASAKKIKGMRGALETVNVGVEMVDSSMSRLFLVLGILDNVVSLFDTFKEWTGIEAQAEADAQALDEALSKAEEYANALQEVFAADKRAQMAKTAEAAEKRVTAQYEDQLRLIRESALVDQQAFALRAQREGNALSIAQSELDLALLKGKITQEEYTIQGLLLKEKEAAQARQLKEDQAAANTRQSREVLAVVQSQRGQVNQRKNQLGSAFDGVGSMEQFEARLKEFQAAQEQLRSNIEVFGINDAITQWSKTEVRDLAKPLQEVYDQLRSMGYEWSSQEEQLEVVRAAYGELTALQSKAVELKRQEATAQEAVTRAEMEASTIQQINADDAATSAAILQNEVEALDQQTQARVAEAQESKRQLELDRARLQVEERLTELKKQRDAAASAGQDTRAIDAEIAALNEGQMAVARQEASREFAAREQEVGRELASAAQGQAVVDAAQQATAQLVSSNQQQQQAWSQLGSAVTANGAATVAALSSATEAFKRSTRQVANASKFRN